MVHAQEPQFIRSERDLAIKISRDVEANIGRLERALGHPIPESWRREHELAKSLMDSGNHREALRHYQGLVLLIDGLTASPKRIPKRKEGMA